jgi:hypothetical protein
MEAKLPSKRLLAWLMVGLTGWLTLEWVALTLITKYWSSPNKKPPGAVREHQGDDAEGVPDPNVVTWRKCSRVPGVGASWGLIIADSLWPDGRHYCAGAAGNRRRAPSAHASRPCGGRDLGIWQRSAGKWATCDTGQKPCALVDIATVDFKGLLTRSME